jgi:energy-coupling factor transport system ATP-binding protein
VRLKGLENRTPAQLSGGQKQRLSIASGLVVTPKLLVLDEPTSQLDPLGTEEVFSVLRALNQDLGITIVLATHKAEQVAQYADRVVVLDQGRLAAEGDPTMVFSQVELLDQIAVPIPGVTRIEINSIGTNNTRPLSVTLDACTLTLIDQFDKGNIKVNVSAGVTAANIEKQSVQSAGSTCIELQDASYKYPDSNDPAVSNVNLKIHSGEFVGVIGQNGAGKSTLMKMVLGLLPPQAGRVLLKGEDISHLRPAEIAQRIGLVLQNPDTQLFALSAWEEVAFGPTNTGLDQDEIDKRVEQALISVGLFDERDQYPFNFSFGDRRKLSVAAVAAMQPEVLIFDEPTTGQDYKGRYELANIARQLNQNGTTVIMITHDMELIAEFTERLIVMGNGQILLDGSTREIFQETEILAETFITPPQVTQLAQSLHDIGFPPDVLTTDEFDGLIKTIS